MAKRIVVLCDGTWSKHDQKNQTNIAKLDDVIPEVGADGVVQKVGYVKGVGVGGARVTQLLGGAFGWGLSANVREGYRHIVEHYEPGDDVYLFGYSRGAYTARSLAGFIRNAGVLRPEHRDKVDAAYRLYRDWRQSTAPTGEEAQRFRDAHSYPDFGIRFIGVFDTVGSLGIPGVDWGWVKKLNERWSFHDTALSSTVRAAFQALAIDEQRKTFAPTLWIVPEDAPDQVVEQVWFAGGHANIGGGSPDPGLSDITLRWMGRKAVSQGLHIDLGELPGNALKGKIGVGRVGFFFTRWPPFDREIATKAPWGQTLSRTARARYDGDERYRPPKLGPAIDGGIPDTEV
ncbi:DUF2235 domain-containing protein [Demequina maris]|uniref:DUF2235 domain-containing protein n=1 Tax=Demequina maris TaxID=1638982 RepID=UPI00078384C3|nr:DUF2235 domain-containing protein [Demequina maris]